VSRLTSAQLAHITQVVTEIQKQQERFATQLQRMEAHMVTEAEAEATLAQAVKDLGARVTAHLTTLQDEIDKLTAASGTTPSPELTAAIAAMQSEAAAIANIDPAAPLITPPTPPADVPPGAPTA
jgi:uncharacterized membrane-anchored protein YhcB (DUF1043 family)